MKITTRYTHLSKKYLAILLLLVIPNLSAHANTTEHKVFTGLWLTEDKDTIIRISHCKQTLCGRIAGFINTTEPYDNLSPDEEKKVAERLRKICSTDFLGGFQLQSEKWVKGWVIDFEDDKKYSANLSLKVV